MKRLSTKLSLVLLGSLLATSFLTGHLVIQGQAEVLTRQLEHDGRVLVRTLAEMAAEPAISYDWQRIADQIENAVKGNRQVVFAQVHDDTGRMSSEYPPRTAGGAKRELPGSVRVVENPIVIAIDDLPREVRGKIVLGLNNDRLAELTSISTGKLVAGTLIGFSVLAIVLWFFLGSQVLSPLKRLDGSVQTISHGDLTKPITTRRKDEIGRLAQGLETMRLNLGDSYRKIEEQVEALKELDRMKDEFLASTSHELKTPLNGIIGLSESLLLGAYGDINHQQQETLELVISCANRLWKMTESILRFSKLHGEGERESSRAESHQLREHLQEALADLRSNAEKSGARLVVSVPEDLHPVYPREELEQVIRILVDNGVKYAAGGVVQVIAQDWGPGSGEGFQIAVRDNGPGIPGHLQKKIFQPFVQGDAHETRTQGGVGLGLAIAAKLVERMGARIILESEAGRGACFTILVPRDKTPPEELERRYLAWPAFSSSIRSHLDRERTNEVVTTTPQIPAVSAQKTEAGPQQAVANPGHVLVVDDESVNREVVWQALRDTYHVTRAADGPSALQVLRTQPIDLVLLDIMMPGMSGYDVLNAMRQEGLLERVPVIVLSAKSSREAVVKGLEHGATDYLGKPFHRAELSCRVKIHIELKRRRDQLAAEVEAKANALQLAEQATKVKNQFLANMSHEIRTPLNGILGFLEICMTTEENEQQLEYLNLMEERTQSLLTIVNDILDVSKIESKEVILRLEPFVPSELVQKLVVEQSPAAARKGLSLTAACDGGAYREVEADRDKVEKILRHLIQNAVKFTREGSIQIQAKLGDSGKQQTLILDVTDTGIGIPEGELEAIFHPFTQVDASMTREFGGAGLGLCVSRAFARMMGGDITVRSSPGKGSTFRVEVEVQRPRPRTAPVTAEPAIAIS